VLTWEKATDLRMQLCMIFHSLSLVRRGEVSKRLSFLVVGIGKTYGRISTLHMRRSLTSCRCVGSFVVDDDIATF
jgi:hypothetical protein